VTQAVLFQLVGPELLPGAVAINSRVNSVSRLIGPAIAGALISTVGVAMCFFVNAASYLVVIGALVVLRTSDLLDRPLALNFATTFPAMVRFGFHLGTGSVAAAMSVSAIGSILGGLYIAGVRPHARRTMAAVLVGFGTSCLALAIAPGFWSFLAVSVVVGFSAAAFQSVNTVVLQQARDPSMQGRIMALHQMAWFGSTPIGALAMGWTIQVSSPRVPFVLGGLSALLCAAMVVDRRLPASGRWLMRSGGTTPKRA
jgi:predicted MFS family arabinose efflux permease